MTDLKQKGFIVPALIIIIVVLLAVVGYLTLGNRVDSVGPQSNTNTPVLTTNEARTLVVDSWGDCTPSSCTRVVVSTEQKDDRWYVTATYEGLRDDSLSAERKVALATFVNNKWTLGTPTVTHSCQKNRGHQDFSTEPCL